MSEKLFICDNCGNEFPRWAGRCDGCGEWNTLKEVAKKDLEAMRGVESDNFLGSAAIVTNLRAAELSGERLVTGWPEWDHFLGGGIVVGSISLFGGEPGIGKSTLMLQISDILIKKNKRVLYVSGEESLMQVGGRAQRLGLSGDKIDFLGGVTLEQLESLLSKEKYDFLVIDSIQTLVSNKISSGMGTVTQIRFCASRLMQLAKNNNITIFLVGHVTKAGEVAGPKVLEHLVDAVIYFEGQRSSDLRVIRALKNRYGSTDETGVFVMTENGLESVTDISKMFLAERKTGIPGSAVGVALEGTRPFLVEIQAIADKTVFGNPRRVSAGIETARLSMLLAVMGKRVGIDIYDKDIYLNVVGGFKLKDRSTDLGVVVALASVILDRTVGENMAFIGEVGLLGEIRAVKSMEKRIREATSMGFTKVFIPRMKNLPAKQVVMVDELKEVLGLIFTNNNNK